jgi:hypothetical protein
LEKFDLPVNLFRHNKQLITYNMNTAPPQFPIACVIHDPMICGVDWEQDCGNCPPEKQNVLSLVEEINSIGYKVSNSQLKKMKEWSQVSQEHSWALYRDGGNGIDKKGHKCLTLIRFPDKKRMVFKPMTL